MMNASVRQRGTCYNASEHGHRPASCGQERTDTHGMMVLIQMNREYDDCLELVRIVVEHLHGVEVERILKWGQVEPGIVWLIFFQNKQ